MRGFRVSYEQLHIFKLQTLNKLLPYVNQQGKSNELVDFNE